VSLLCSSQNKPIVSYTALVAHGSISYYFMQD
jgi:hypothetical protein